MSIFLFGVRGRLSRRYTGGHSQLIDRKLTRGLARVASGFRPPRLARGALMISKLFNSKLGRPLSNKFTSLIDCVGRSPTRIIDVSVPSKLVARDGQPRSGPTMIETGIALALRAGGLTVFFTSYRRCLNRIYALSVHLSGCFVSAVPTACSAISPSCVGDRVLGHSSFTRGNSVNGTLLVTKDHNVTNTTVLTSGTYVHDNTKGIATLAPRYGLNVVRVTIPRTIYLISHRDCCSRTVSASKFRTINVNPKLNGRRDSTLTLVSRLRRADYPVILSTSTLGVLKSRNA